MVERALAWAETLLGERLRASAPLRGGMTSTMLRLSAESGHEAVLRLMTEEPWRSHGADLVERERRAMVELEASEVPAPSSIGRDRDVAGSGVAAHLMSKLPGEPVYSIDGAGLTAMADVLVAIHGHRPTTPFRAFQSWAWDAKWVVPPWTRHPDSWERAFELLAKAPPGYEPTFLHRDYGHHNLLWQDGAVCGVVDWVEASTGPAWLDAGHAATNLAVAFDVALGRSFVDTYAATAASPPQTYWMVMDAVGFLPPPGKRPMFDDADQLSRLDDWLHLLMGGDLWHR